MKMKTKTTAMPDWREDPEVQNLARAEQDASAEQVRLEAQLRDARAAAEKASRRALQVEVFQIVDRATAEDLQRARAEHRERRDRVEQLSDTIDHQARRQEVAAGMRQQVTIEAQQRVAPVLADKFRAQAATLAAAVRAARDAADGLRGAHAEIVNQFADRMMADGRYVAPPDLLGLAVDELVDLLLEDSRVREGGGLADRWLRTAEAHGCK